LVALDTPANLRHGAPAGLRFRARAGLDTAALGAALGVPVHEPEPGHYAAAGPPTPSQVAHLAAWLAGQDVLLTELTAGDHSLEEAYLALTAGSATAPR
ncbi:MAG TPA: ABC transporter ATP-binding protein, partial [Chloroflexota bacterium]|nr:ABC transporter ATP-binding protein [Chloroflexota bacterium]